MDRDPELFIALKGTETQKLIKTRDQGKRGSIKEQFGRQIISGDKMVVTMNPEQIGTHIPKKVGKGTQKQEW